MNIASLTPSQLRQAANLKEKIAGLEKDLGQLLGAGAALVVVKPAARKKGEMSASGKARIVAAQKARWAKIKAAKIKPAAVTAVVKAVVVPKPAKKKFTMSAAAKAKLSAAAKARWAKIKSAKQ